MIRRCWIEHWVTFHAHLSALLRWKWHSRFTASLNRASCRWLVSFEYLNPRAAPRGSRLPRTRAITKHTQRLQSWVVAVIRAPCCACLKAGDALPFLSPLISLVATTPSIATPASVHYLAPLFTFVLYLSFLSSLSPPPLPFLSSSILHNCAVTKHLLLGTHIHTLRHQVNR